MVKNVEGLIYGECERSGTLHFAVIVLIYTVAYKNRSHAGQ